MSLIGMAACRAISGVWKHMSGFECARLLPYLEQTANAKGSNEGIKLLLPPSPEEISRVGNEKKDSLYVLERSSSVVIKPHPRIITAQEAQIMSRYAPERVTAIPEMPDITAEPRENGIILKSMSCGSEHSRILTGSHLIPAPVADDPRTW